MIESALYLFSLLLLIQWFLRGAKLIFGFSLPALPIDPVGVFLMLLILWRCGLRALIKRKVVWRNTEYSVDELKAYLKSF